MSIRNIINKYASRFSRHAGRKARYGSSNNQIPFFSGIKIMYPIDNCSAVEQFDNIYQLIKNMALEADRVGMCKDNRVIVLNISAYKEAYNILVDQGIKKILGYKIIWR